MRDLRDPQKLGEAYLDMRAGGVSIGHAVNAGVEPYRDGGFISSNPADHHSQTSQRIGDLNDGGA